MEMNKFEIARQLMTITNWPDWSWTSRGTKIDKRRRDKAEGCNTIYPAWKVGNSILMWEAVWALKSSKYIVLVGKVNPQVAKSRREQGWTRNYRDRARRRA